ncbi:unnamed protein product [Ceutorhynchus assimilis]|uniref:SIAH-type domain-containing protein n=1 Tax=Ceutorhynchus assimilis TaxID=467358 RepID=A0A9N9MG49_9CUCU|nr:unnamed protein product [Ceutorhynchus assimilis]
MAYALPESILSKQVCSNCKQYLSFPPTKNYFNGEIKCGRCSSINDNNCTVSSYEILAKNLMFPCVNRFGGCPKMLHYEDVKKHENHCVSNIVLKCPLCQEIEGSVLYLIHHFKIEHPKELLLKPKIVISDFSQKISNKIFLYCDYETARVFYLTISWEMRNFFLTCATIVDDRKIPQVFLKFFDEDDKLIHETNPEKCMGLPDFLSDREQFVFVPPAELTRFCCYIKFDHSAPLMQIQQFHLQKTDKYKKQTLRKMYLDEEFKNKYEQMDLRTFKLSANYLQLINEKIVLQIACDFCENFFASSGFDKKIYNDPSEDSSCFVCGTCYSRGITKSLKNSGTQKLELLDAGNSPFYLLNFYCKFGCNKFCRSGELLSHEDHCEFNMKRDLSGEEYVKLVFDKHFINGQKYNRENVILEPNKLKAKGKIFIATRDNFKCIIDYDVDYTHSKCNFHVNHNYDSRIYYILVHKWENQKFSVEYNDFSMKTIVDRDSPSMFAVILKEVHKDLEVFYDT